MSYCGPVPFSQTPALQTAKDGLLKGKGSGHNEQVATATEKGAPATRDSKKVSPMSQA